MSQNTPFQALWNIEDGLHQRSVSHVTRDGKGKFWVFTESSVQLFDGQGFESVALPAEYNPQHLLDIVPLEDNALYARMSDGRDYLIDAISLSFEGLDTAVNYVAFDGKLWEWSIGKERIRFNEWKGDSSFAYTWCTVEKPIDIQRYGTEALVFLTKFGKVYLADKNSCKHVFSDVDELVGQVNDRFMIFKDSLFYRIDRQGQPLLYKGRKHGDYLYAQDARGQSMIAYSYQQNRYRRVELFTGDTIVDYRNELIGSGSNTLRCMYSEDFRQKILVGGFTGLAYRGVFPEVLHLLDDQEYEESALNGEVIRWVVDRKKDDRLYFAEESQGLYSTKAYDIQSLKKIKQENISRGNRYACYVEKHDMIAYSSRTSRENVLHFYGFQGYTEQIGVPFYIRSLVSHESDILFICGQGKSLNIMSWNMLSRQPVDSLYVPEMSGGVFDLLFMEDHLYLGGPDGLFRAAYDEEEGHLSLDSLERISDHFVLDLFYRNQKIYVGTYHNGVQIYHSAAPLHSSMTVHGLPSLLVHTVASFQDSMIALLSQEGLIILNTEDEIVKVFDRENGLSSNELNRMAIAEMSDGGLALGTLNGLTLIPPKVIARPSIPTELVLDQLRFTRGGIQSSIYVRGQEQVRLPYNAQNIQLTFKDYDYHQNALHSKVDYQYDFLWPESTVKYENNTVTLGEISNGRQNFRWTQKPCIVSVPQERSIEIYKPSFFREYLVYILIAFFSLLLSFLLIRQEIRRRRRERLGIEKEMKARLNELKLTALRSQMNPHFIFNALGAIQYYIQTQETDLADDYLTKFAQLMRKYLDHSTKNSILLREELQILELYTDLENIRYEHSFEVQWAVSDELRKGEYYIPTMLLQPFVENAIKHGLDSRTDGKGKLSIEVHKAGDVIKISIMDNGIGMKQSQAKTKLHKSKALGLISDKMDLLNQSGLFSVDITVVDRELSLEYPGTEILINVKDLRNDISHNN